MSAHAFWMTDPVVQHSLLQPRSRILGRQSAAADDRRDAGRARRLVAALRIVLDLRGNGGGSSDWLRQIAEALWGPTVLELLPSQDIHVDWRGSPANLAAMEQAYAQQKTGETLSPEMRNWFETVMAGLGAALQRDDGLWHQPARDGEEEPRQYRTVPSPLSGPVYLLTDASCRSACLNAVDLWKAVGQPI